MRVSAVSVLRVLAGSRRAWAALAATTSPVARSARTHETSLSAGGGGTSDGRSTTRPMDASRSPPTESRGSTVARGTGSVGRLGVGRGAPERAGAGAAAATETAGDATAPPTASRTLAAAAVRGSRTLALELVRQQGALDLLDRLGDLDAAGAGLGAVEGRAAAPHALLVVEDLQALLGGLVAAVEDEPVRVDDGGRAEVLPVGPEHLAAGRAGRAQDALGGVVEPVLVGLALQALLGRLVAVGHQERHDLAVGVEERLHVDDEVLLHGKALDRLDGDRLVRVDVLDERLAGEPVLAVDPHRVRAAHAVGAGAAEAQRAVLLPLDLVQRVEDAVRGVREDLVLLEVRLGVDLGVEPLDAQRDGERRDLAGGGGPARGLLGDSSHQYLRSIGW